MTKDVADISIPLPSWSQIIQRVIMARGEQGDIDYNQLVGEELATEQVAELMVVLGEIATSAGIAKGAIATELARRMKEEDRTGLEAAGQWVTFKPKRSTKVSNIEGYWKYMLANPELLPKAFNPNDTRKTGIPSSVFDTFFETTEGSEPVLSTIPLTVLEENRNKRARQE